VTSIGATRRIDHLGRIVVPVELRRSLGINDGDALEIAANGDELVLRKVAPGCAICGGTEKLVQMHDKHLCTDCVREIQREPELLKAAV